MQSQFWVIIESQLKSDSKLTLFPRTKQKYYTFKKMSKKLSLYFKNLCGLACLFRKSWEVRTHTGIQSESLSGLKIELFLTIPFSLGSLAGTPCYFFFCYYHFSCHLSYWRETVVRVCPNPITRGLFYGVTEHLLLKVCQTRHMIVSR